MRLSLSLALLIAAAAFTSAEKERYDGHQVLRFTPQTPRELLVFDAIQKNSEMRFDFWEEPTKVGQSIDVRVSPEQKEKLSGLARMMGMDFEVLIEDVQKLVDETVVAPLGTKMSWTAYHRFDDIMQWVDETTAAHSDIVETSTIGTSSLGNDIKLMRINKQSGQEKTGVFIESHVHAREWITSATMTWIFNELLNNPAHSEILDQYDFHFLPVLNPDGYEYTHTDSRMWRKTLSDHGSFWGCLGVDGNRNWDKSFGGPGTSSDKCSDLYHGPNAFSEPEIKASSDYIMAHKSEIHTFFDVHSYSQLVLLPWGDTYDHPEDYDEMMNLGLILENGLAERYGTQYATGSVPDLLYLASGGAFDWVKDVAGVKYAYGIELRDEGNYGFLLPADQIIPSGEETLDGLLAFIAAVRAETMH